MRQYDKCNPKNYGGNSVVGELCIFNVEGECISIEKCFCKEGELKNDN